jgi:hypothetical protein
MSLTINGTTNTITGAAGLAIAANTAITGTLSATGVISSSGGAVIPGALGLGSQNYLGAQSSNTWVNAPSGQIVYVSIANNAVGTWQSTGLAVAGTISASGITSVTDTTDATSTTAASLKTAGGLAVAKKLHVGTLVDLSAAAAGQIKFPATPNASADYNTLDDYQEHQLNSFVPTLTFGGGSTGMTISSYRTLATKVGPLITFWIQIALSAKGSSTGAAVVGGLPYTSWNDGATNPMVAMGFSNLTFSGQVYGQVINNSATIGLYSTASGGAQAALTDTAFANTTVLTISGSYWINH